jgi:hypothetical protein
MEDWKKVSGRDVEREDECGICMEACTKMVLPNCSHAMSTAAPQSHAEHSRLQSRAEHSRLPSRATLPPRAPPRRAPNAEDDFRLPSRI